MQPPSDRSSVHGFARLVHTNILGNKFTIDDNILSPNYLFLTLNSLLWHSLQLCVLETKQAIFFIYLC